MHAPRHRGAQRGTTLLEAMIAFVVLGLGILTVARLQVHLRLGSDIARQRSEAVRIGQQDIETIRSFSVIAASTGARSYAEIASSAATIDGASGYLTNTSYTLTREIRSGDSNHSKSASVKVAWSDRAGGDQQIVLQTIIAGQDPLYAAALRLPPAGFPVRGAYRRSSFVPLSARDLGDGRSVLKPVEGGNIAYLFDNATGLVTGRCTAVGAAIASRDLTETDLAGCDANVGYLVSGSIRFSSAIPPDPAHANDPPLSLAVVLTTSGGTYPLVPSCAGEATKTVSYTSGGTMRIESVPIAATPASLGLPDWTDTGDRQIGYRCVVYPPAGGGRWSGRTTLVPAGWTLGTGATDRRVCRYSADTDGSGAVDSNIEHPPEYAAVAEALAHQNFLVIAGGQSCPGGSASPVDGLVADDATNLATAPHQP